MLIRYSHETGKKIAKTLVGKESHSVCYSRVSLTRNCVATDDTSKPKPHADWLVFRRTHGKPANQRINEKEIIQKRSENGVVERECDPRISSTVDSHNVPTLPTTSTSTTNTTKASSPQAASTSMGLISALEKMVITTSGDDDNNTPLVLPSRTPPRKGGRFGGTTTSGSVAATESNTTACTSPLTITSLEQAAVANTTSSVSSTNKNNASSSSNYTSWVPKEVSSTRAYKNSNIKHSLSLGGGVSSAAAATATEEHRSSDALEDGTTTRRVVHHHQRTPPTEYDHRKLFVGGLPTNGERK